MRWLVLFGLVGSVACTRVNPSYGPADGGTDKGEDGSSGRADASVSVGEDAEASAEEASSIETGASAGTSDGTGKSRPCCFAHAELGCEDTVIEECVCAGEPACCEVGWHDACVEKARIFCSAECSIDEEEGPLDTSDTMPSDGTSTTSGGSTTQGSESTTSDEASSTGAPVSDCCVTHDGPGCDDPVTENCVCFENQQEACCDISWSALCVDTAEDCGAVCGG
jgi:hypothetical protein